jgi:hypothetical protein
LEKWYTLHKKNKVKVKLLLCLSFMHHAMKTYAGVNIWLYVFIILGLDGEQSALPFLGRSDQYTLARIMVGPRAGLNSGQKEKVSGLP